jgi:hypothetical protein
MAQTPLKGLQVSADKRNAKTVALLIGSMTFGAAVLLELEPPTRGWSAGTLLMAESVAAVDEVRIEYVDAGRAADRAGYECLVLPDGACEWRPNGPRIRLAVVGSTGQAFPEAQGRTLLAVFGALTQRHGLELEGVWLDPASDARLHPELPAPAHRLVELLARKGIVP